MTNSGRQKLPATINQLKRMHMREALVTRSETLADQVPDMTASRASKRMMAALHKTH